MRACGAARVTRHAAAAACLFPPCRRRSAPSVAVCFEACVWRRCYAPSDAYAYADAYEQAERVATAFSGKEAMVLSQASTRHTSAGGVKV